MPDEKDVDVDTEDEPGEEAPETSSKDMEAKARDMGWRPKEDFKGDPSAWRDAPEYVRRGEEILPVVRSRLEKSEARNAELADKLERANKDFAGKFKRLEHMSEVALTKQAEQLKSQYAARKEAAVQAGDLDEYRRADKEEDDALGDLAEKTKPPVEASQDGAFDALPPATRTTIKGWVDDNTWFTTDKEMNALASAHHEKLLTEKPGMTLTQNLTAVRDYVKRKFPEKFGEEEAPARGSRVEGGGRSSGGASGSLWAKLPADAKAQADKFIEKDGLFLKRGETLEKDQQKARERYAKEYLES